jgi:cation transport protein ChaC
MIFQSRVYGVAYELADDESSVPIKNRLDEREKRYEKTADVPFYAAVDDSSVSLTCSVYIGPLNGPLYLGPAPAELMARQIVESAGPSGTNLDYFTRLSDFMKNEIGSVDSHLVELEAAVQSVIDNQ